MFTTSSLSGRLTDRLPGTGLGVARIGCSGWHYKHWRGSVYDEALPSTAWLRDYARRFPTVEINNSFYRYFNNDMNGHAVTDATRLTEMIETLVTNDTSGRAVANVRTRRLTK
jgi:uncharacterized protein YecE (DUF72 family)